MSLARHHVPHLIARVSTRRAETPRRLVCVCVCVSDHDARERGHPWNDKKPWQSGVPCVSALPVPGLQQRRFRASAELPADSASSGATNHGEKGETPARGAKPAAASATSGGAVSTPQGPADWLPSVFIR